MKYIHYLHESKHKRKKVVIVSNHLPKLKKQFIKLFTKIPTAGGVVLNERQEILFIYKNKQWRLPKGKLKKKEAKRKAALREVHEETLVKDLRIEKKLGKTHVIKLESSGRWTMKICHWFLMYAPNQKLSPRIEEGIEKAFWMSPSEYYKIQPKSEPTLQELLYIFSFLFSNIKQLEYEKV